ncbi:hypothetical protein Gorai_007338 [Gossypium raimondii]|uniref:Uncharacterized protein n=1 Tax=Gossypium raimondii TaxID=29730 RepID=A0A7J8Q7I4_GOSRA|nr:hypothetical protein [Gossypium raimondii]
MGEVIAIDWRDREGCWIEFIRVQVGKWRGGVEILEVDKTLHEEGGRTESTAEARGIRNKRKKNMGLDGDGIEQSPIQMRLRNPATVGELRQLLASKDLDINFLSKTRMWANELEHVRVRCRLEGYFFVESEGRKGGLVLLWKEIVDVRVQNHSMHHIYSLVKGAGQYHFRGRCKPRVAMDDFQKGIEDLALVDIKIDRASWLDKVPFLSMEVVRQENSDHDAILLDSLGRVRSQLGLWQHRWFKRMKSRMYRLVDQIDRFIDGPCMDSNTEMLRTTRAELGNIIEGQFDADGYWVDGSNDMCGVAWDYFHKLFKFKANGNDERFLGQIQRCINLEMNNVLDKRLTDKQILEAFNQMDPCKAPDIDGLLGLFYKEN